MINELMTLPSMTVDAAQRLIRVGTTTRAALHDWLAYAPKVIAYEAQVSMHRCELWLDELNRNEYQSPEVQP